MKTIVITGASRGIGGEMATFFALCGWRVVILAKHALTPHPKLDGARTVAEEIKHWDGKVLAIATDVRFEDQVNGAMTQAAEFGDGKIDVLINNASAIILQPIEKQIRLMNQVIVAGTRLCTEACLPYLKKSNNPHVLSISPPLPMKEHWVEEYGAYALAKRAVSEYMEKMAEEHPGIFFGTLWPKCMIYTAATIHLFGKEEARRHTRHPSIMSSAAYNLLCGFRHTGNFFIDEDVLREGGETDFDHYLMTPGDVPYPDIFV